uniref:Uncharacterized protein n=3 Tax=Meloidogyne enterolobii TaxID=390850 RepID=A0A6V7XFV3_MELEN|nr:unnamed protein product [Meloidogyne enterolobii]
MSKFCNNYLITALFVLFLTTNLSLTTSNFIQNKTSILCKDGKGPLLEGEERVFQCFDNDCPAGFECENNNGSGICCPNLPELFKLYNEVSAEIKREGSNEGVNREQLNNNEQNQSESIINAMELLEKHYGKLIARERPPSIENKTTKSSIFPSLSSQNNSPINSQSVRDSPVALEEIKKQQLFEANIWKPKNLFSKKIYVDASGEEFSCKRQRLETFCENGNKRTQFVMRWFAKEGICYSYPWGYCPGEPIATDKTIRTLKECEALCTDKLDKYLIKEEEQPNNKQISGVVRLMEKEEIKEEKETTITTSTLQTINIDSENEKNNLESYKIIANSSSFHYPPQNNPIKVPPSSASAELAEFLLSEQRPNIKSKRCEKITPYRTICPSNGLTSQFTLRWYQRGNNCFAYPYGYCNDSIFEEEPIKTEKECLLICIQRREEGGWMSRRRRLLKK